MKRTPQERETLNASFQKMSLADKADYIWTYYKLPITLGLAALLLLCSTVYRQVTKKEAVLYSALINVTVGEDLDVQLNEGFVASIGASPQKSEVSLYRGMYLSNDPSPENHQYGYASKLKLMAAIEAKQLDVVLMNREAYDIFSQKGYLLDLGELLAAEGPLYQTLESQLITNTVILEDNAIEYSLNEASRYEAVTEETANALDVSAYPIFRAAGFSDPVYLGVVGNSLRIPAVLQYIAYLTGAQNEAQSPTG